MTPAKRGRPRRDEQLQKADILKAALHILDSSGHDALSMRTLAARLKVTPMALYHHVADRSALLRDLADWVYAGVVEENKDAPARKRIETMLLAYHSAVLRHPHLTLSIFADPAAFSDEARRITQELSNHLGEAKLTPHARELWLDILVDFTHGSSMATAISGRAQPQTKGFMKKESGKFAERLNQLLVLIF